MEIEQIYTGCLAQGAYYIKSGGEAAIIDPLREVSSYLDRLQKDGVKLKYIFETHFHADFVSGHLDLSKQTGASIVYGPTAVTEFDSVKAKDEQVFKVGDVTIKVLHTPGHTMESVSFLLLDENDKEHALFSGDTLFIGDVGRPDLAQKAASMTQEDLAGLLFKSLREKVMTLDDKVIVFPGHGAGSACGKKMSKETVSTIGAQKQNNYALRADMTQSEFVKEVTDGLLPPPGYFGMNVAMNKNGYTNFNEVLSNSMLPLTVQGFNEAAEQHDAVIIDTRNAQSFAKGFVPKSINIAIKGDFAPWVGALIMNVDTPILLVTEKGEEEEVITRLSRVGFDHVIGYLEGSFDAWKSEGQEVDFVKSIDADTFEEQFNEEVVVVDVRKQSEYAAEHVDGAFNKPLSQINEWVSSLDEKKHFYLHCAGGYRSMIAASILQARGVRNFTEVKGGFNSILKTKITKTNFVCQSKVS